MKKVYPKRYLINGTISLYLIVLLSACATTVEKVYLKDGSTGYMINCSDGKGSSWGTCYQKAGELCKEKGYLVIKETDDSSFSSGFVGGYIDKQPVVGGGSRTRTQRYLFITCKEEQNEVKKDFISPTIGCIKGDCKNGQGTLIFSSGTQYAGGFTDGNLDGQGTLTLYDGSKYVGEFKDDLVNGQGTFTLSNGSKYVGGFKNGDYGGQGTFTFPDGSKYVGVWKDGNYNGQGTLTFPDGTIYIGEFEKGKYDGQGTLVSPDAEPVNNFWTLIEKNY